MKRIKISLVLCIVFLSQCGKPEKVLNAEKVVTSFFKALKEGDTTKQYNLYPKFKKLPGFYKSDSMFIESYNRVKGGIEIVVKNSFTNPKKVKFSQTITMVVSDDDSNMKIIDSKGMCDFNGKELYEFGRKTGCVSSDTTLSDQTKVGQMETAEKVMQSKVLDLIKELKDSVPITGLKTKDMFGFLSGSAKIVNNSPYPLTFVKYEVMLSDGNGVELKKEDGYAVIDTLATGMDKEFNFLIQPPAGTKNLDVRLIYDNYFLLETMASKKWTGKECDEITKK